MCCTLCGAGPQHFVITGNVEVRRSDSLALVSQQGTTLAVAPIAPNGDFTLSGNVASPGLYLIEARGDRLTIPVYLEGGEYALEGDRWSYRVAGPKGSVQAQYVDYLNERQQIMERQFALGQEYEKAPDMNAKVAVGERMDTVNRLLDQQLIAGLEKFNNTELTPYIAAENLFMLEVDFRAFQKAAEILARNTTGSPLTDKVMDKFRTVEQSRLSGTAPDFELPDTEGRLVKLSSMRGHWVLLDFWASWCAPCRKKNKQLVKHATELQNNDVRVVSLSLDDDEKAWRRAVAEDNVGWLQLVDLTGFKDSSIRELYKVTNVPTVFLIDPQGQVAAINPEIDEVLALTAK